MGSICIYDQLPPETKKVVDDARKETMREIARDLDSNPAIIELRRILEQSKQHLNQ